MYRRILAVTAMAYALAACGASGSAAPQAGNSAAPSSGASTAAPAPTAGASTAAPVPTAAPTAEAPATTAPAATAASTEQPKEGSMPEQPADEQSAMVAIATQDLAKRLNIAADKIATKSVEEVDWNNGALGCAQPDMSYTQVIISGFKIVLEADGKSYDYHTDRTKRVVLCENSSPTGKLKQP